MGGPEIAQGKRGFASAAPGHLIKRRRGLKGRDKNARQHSRRQTFPNPCISRAPSGLLPWGRGGFPGLHSQSLAYPGLSHAAPLAQGNRSECPSNRQSLGSRSAVARHRLAGDGPLLKIGRYEGLPIQRNSDALALNEAPIPVRPILSFPTLRLCVSASICTLNPVFPLLSAPLHPSKSRGRTR